MALILSLQRKEKLLVFILHKMIRSRLFKGCIWLIALSKLELVADGVLRSRHCAPFVVEYRSWSADYVIQWDMDSFVPSNLQPSVIPWREGSFSDRFSEWAAFLEWRFLYARVSLTQSKKAFGLLKEVSPPLDESGFAGADCLYGTLGSSCDLGINFLFNR